MIGVQVLGKAELRRWLDRKDDKAIKALRRGLKKAGLFLQRVSQLIVPVDTANLKNSAFTRDITTAETKPVVIVGYTANYAIYVHERTELRHKPGKKAKFLEQPLREKMPEIKAIVVKELSRV